MNNTEILIITGPTAVGKTRLAIRLASLLDGEIISADSRQIYRQLNIGTGKPNQQQLATIRHHCISAIDISSSVTADSYARMARAAYEDIKFRNKRCLVVGGTGLWIRAFIDGLAPVPPADHDFRRFLQKRTEQTGLESLYRQLQGCDPESASHINPHDQLRIIRALEIFHLTGRSAYQLYREKPQQSSLPAKWFALQLPKTMLDARAEKCIDEWLTLGWIEEAKQNMQTGLLGQTTALQAIGYPILFRYLQGVLKLDEAVRLIKRDTRRYIKRQLTWCRSEKRLLWIDNQDEDAALAEILARST